MSLPKGKYKVPSESREGRTYTVTVVSQTKATCSCAGFRRWKHCKHATAMVAGEYNLAS